LYSTGFTGGLCCHLPQQLSVVSIGLAGFKILLSISATCLATGHLAHKAHGT
jgi:hypothetical protein